MDFSNTVFNRDKYKKNVETLEAVNKNLRNVNKLLAECGKIDSLRSGCIAEISEAFKDSGNKHTLHQAIKDDAVGSARDFPRATIEEVVNLLLVNKGSRFGASINALANAYLNLVMIGQALGDEKRLALDVYKKEQCIETLNHIYRRMITGAVSVGTVLGTIVLAYCLGFKLPFQQLTRDEVKILEALPELCVLSNKVSEPNSEIIKVQKLCNANGYSPVIIYKGNASNTKPEVVIKATKEKAN